MFPIVAKNTLHEFRLCLVEHLPVSFIYREVCFLMFCCWRRWSFISYSLDLYLWLQFNSCRYLIRRWLLFWNCLFYTLISTLNLSLIFNEFGLLFDCKLLRSQICFLIFFAIALSAQTWTLTNGTHPVFRIFLYCYPWFFVVLF